MFNLVENIIRPCMVTETPPYMVGIRRKNRKTDPTKKYFHIWNNKSSNNFLIFIEILAIYDFLINE